MMKEVKLGFLSFASKLVVERQQVVHVTSSRRSLGRDEKDTRFDGVGYGTAKVGPNYPSVVVVFILAQNRILVFCFLI
jgi:hypothetical protein